MDADYRQYSKPEGGGCCWAVIWISALFLALLTAHLHAYLFGISRPEYDAITPEKEPAYWSGIAIEGIVIGSVLAAAIVRLRRMRRHPANQNTGSERDHRRFVESCCATMIRLSAAGQLCVVIIGGLVYYRAPGFTNSARTWTTIAMDTIVLVSLMVGSIVRRRHERRQAEQLTPRSIQTR